MIRFSGTTWLPLTNTIYGKTFQGATFVVTTKNLSLEKFHGLAVSAVISSEY